MHCGNCTLPPFHTKIPPKKPNLTPTCGNVASGDRLLLTFGVGGNWVMGWWVQAPPTPRPTSSVTRGTYKKTLKMPHQPSTLTTPSTDHLNQIYVEMKWKVVWFGRGEMFAASILRRFASLPGSDGKGGIDLWEPGADGAQPRCSISFSMSCPNLLKPVQPNSNVKDLMCESSLKLLLRINLFNEKIFWQSPCSTYNWDRMHLAAHTC